MCLSVPGKIVAMKGARGTINFDGLNREADLSLLENPQLGDWVLIHVGFAIQRIDEKTARETYRLLAESGGLENELR